MPRRLLPFWRAVSRQLPFSTLLAVADEGVGVPRDVKPQGDLWVCAVEEVQTCLDVLLPDVTVGSLSTGHEVTCGKLRCNARARTYIHTHMTFYVKYFLRIIIF